MPIPFAYMSPMVIDENGNDDYTTFLYHGNTTTNVAKSAPSGISVALVASSSVNNTSYRKFPVDGSIYTTSQGSFKVSGITTSSFDANGNYTIDFWYYTGSNSITGPLFTIGDSSRTSYYSVRLYKSNPGITLMAHNSAGKYVVNSVYGTALPLNTFYHIALVKSGTSMKLYINGSLAISTSGSGLYQGNTMHIGGSRNAVAYTDEFRLSKIARWTSNFTPPTSVYG